MTTTPALSRYWRQCALGLVVVGAMAVSINGQVRALSTGHDGVDGFAVVYALVNDAGAILALEAALSAPAKSAIRKWAWVAILVAAGTGASLNAWHVANPSVPLPWQFGLAIGIEPIVLILVLSHLMGLVMDKLRQRDPNTGTDREPAPARAHREDREVASTGPRVPTASSAPATASLVATVGIPDREVAPAPTASSRPAVAASTRPAAVRQTVTPTPSPRLRLLPGRRPDWMTDELVAAVVASMRKVGAPEKRYGEPRLRREHRHADGSEITSYQAKELLRYIRDNDLLRESA